METVYDVVIIGAGAVAENVAEAVVLGGLTAVVIESDLVGGECSYWACMPSKALLRSGSALRSAQRVDGARQGATGVVDVERTLARRNAFTHDWHDQSQVDWLATAGIALLRGHGRITGKRSVTVETPDKQSIQLLARQAVVVATGSEAALPDIPGLASAAPWTPREATSAQKIPQSLIVLGGGVVGVELATAYAGLGCAVTILTRGAILGGVEDFAGEFVARGLRRLGVSILSGVTVQSLSRIADTTTATLNDGRTISAAEFLIAAGRAPRSTDIGLETIGLLPGDWIHVDDTLLATGEPNADEPWLYAVGDINKRALLTHQGKYQARAAGDAIVARAFAQEMFTEPWGKHVATADTLAVPQVIFSDPEVASVGFTTAAARAAGIRIRVADYDLGRVAGASLHSDHYEGKARIVVAEERQVIIGATFVGPDVAELVHAATIAIVGEVPLARLWHAVPAYPTISEVWLRLLEAYRRSSDE